jgi:hypothetical protein
MKKLFIITALVLLASCKKNWDCSVSQKWNEAEYVEAGTVNFEGSKDEMKEYEISNTTETEIGESILYIKTECK